MAVHGRCSHAVNALQRSQRRVRADRVSWSGRYSLSLLFCFSLYLSVVLLVTAYLQVDSATSLRASLSGAVCSRGAGSGWTPDMCSRPSSKARFFWLRCEEAVLPTVG